MNVAVVDMSSGDARPRIPDFAKMASAGLIGIIHRATEGIQFTDPLYIDRRVAALAAGLLWGAYHTIDAGNVNLQAERFLNACGLYDQNIDANKLLFAVDFSMIAQPAALHQLYSFCGAIDRGTPAGASIVIRGGPYLRTTLTKDNPGADNIGIAAFMRQHRLWSDEKQYIMETPAPPPWPWQKAWLRSVEPFPVNPAIGKIGCNVGDGDLRNNWVS